MNMYWPQITIRTGAAIGLFVTAAKNGGSRIEKYNFALKLYSVGLEIWLLWCGGFFA